MSSIKHRESGNNQVFSLEEMTDKYHINLWNGTEVEDGLVSNT